MFSGRFLARGLAGALAMPRALMPTGVATRTVAPRAATTVGIRCFNHVKMASTLIRKPAPKFSAQAVVNEEFVRTSLDSLIAGGKWLVLFSYPADFTFVCPTEIIAFSDRAGEFAACNANVAAFSTDTEHCHLAWIQTSRNKGGLGKMNIPVIADTTKKIAKAYGVLVEEETDDMCGLALRGTIIIDPKGIVRSVQCNDAPAGRSVDETLRVLQALQYADEHGEVCPAGWKKGDAAMKPTKAGVAEYLSKSS